MLEPGHISETEMQRLLAQAYEQDPERSLLGQIARQLRDPTNPRDANYHPRPHPLWLALGVIVAFALAVFLYFSFVRPSP